MADPRPIAAIVLAAGTSQRFGSDKLRHPLNVAGVTLPLAAHSLLPWLETFGRVTVVTQPAAFSLRELIAAALGATRAAAIHWVECPDAARGMAASLQCGVRANGAATGWLIGLADMPGVPAHAISAVRNALLHGAALAAPYHAGRRGHPVGFSRGYYRELLELDGDAGARRLLERDRDLVFQVACTDNGILADIDSPADLLQRPISLPDQGYAPKTCSKPGTPLNPQRNS